MLVVSMEGVEEVPQTDRAVRWWSWHVSFQAGDRYYILLVKLSNIKWGHGLVV